MTAETKSPSRSKGSRFFTLGKLTIGVLLLIPAALVGYRAYEVFSTPAVGEPFDVEAFAAYTLPEEQNAFVHYRKAIELFVPTQKVLESDPAADPQKFFDSQSAAADGWEHAIPAV